MIPTSDSSMLRCLRAAAHAWLELLSSCPPSCTFASLLLFSYSPPLGADSILYLKSTFHAKKEETVGKYQASPPGIAPRTRVILAKNVFFFRSSFISANSDFSGWHPPLSPGSTTRNGCAISILCLRTADQMVQRIPSVSGLGFLHTWPEGTL